MDRQTWIDMHDDERNRLIAIKVFGFNPKIKTAKDIHEAVFSRFIAFQGDYSQFQFNGRDYYFANTRELSEEDVFYLIWEQRDGMPWAFDVELEVEHWQKKHPPYCSCPAEALNVVRALSESHLVCTSVESRVRSVLFVAECCGAETGGSSSPPQPFAPAICYAALSYFDELEKHNASKI